MNRKIMGVSLVSFFASIAGIIVSFMLLKEDVTSTAHTLFEYFPQTFQVIPSESWRGAVILGIFVSLLQIISASVAFSNRFSIPMRIMSAGVLLASGLFDIWTDVVFRSNDLTGNMEVAIITTLAFYTFGSEIAQSLSWVVFLSIWRLAISDLMWAVAKFSAGMSSIAAEWTSFTRAAHRREMKDREIPESNPYKQSQKPVYNSQKSPSRPYNEEAYRTLPKSDKKKDYPVYHPVGLNVNEKDGE